MGPEDNKPDEATIYEDEDGYTHFDGLPDGTV